MSQPSAARRPELDQLRFLAFFSVFLHHLGDRVALPTAGALTRAVVAVNQAFGFGLTLFFVLSAFLITRLLLAEARTSGSIDVVRFWLRRGFRIWPLYVVGLLIGWALAEGSEQLAMLRWYSVFGGNLFFVDHGWNDNPMTPLWSLSSEEQFYVLLPMALVAFGTARAGLIGLAGITLGIGGVWFLGSMHLSVDTVIWSSPATSMIAFGAGVVLAAETEGRTLALPIWVRLLIVLGAIGGFALAVGVFDGKSMFPARSGEMAMAGQISAVAACVALIVAVISGPMPKSPMIAELGRISYGLYVFHMLGLHIAETIAGVDFFGRPILGLAITVGLAMISDRFLEQPFLRLRERFVAPAAKPA